MYYGGIESRRAQNTIERLRRRQHISEGDFQRLILANFSMAQIWIPEKLLTNRAQSRNFRVVYSSFNKVAKYFFVTVKKF